MKHSSFHRFAALLTLAVCCVISAFASPTSQKVTVRFDESMFKIDGTDNVIKNIQYLKGASSMPADTCLPALPTIPVIVSGPAGSTCDFTYRIVEKHLIFEDVDLIAAPRVVSSVEMRKMTAPAAPRLFKLKAATYPTEAIQYRTRSPWADATDFHFACTPFVYDAASRSLYLIDEIELTVNYSDAPAAKLSATTERSLTPRPSFLKAPLGMLGFNPLDSLKKPFVPVDTQITVKPILPPISEEFDLPRKEYVIITSEKLKPAFEKLAKWKEIKGIDPLIETVENIAKNFDGVDIPMKIKQFLRSVRIWGRDDKSINPIKYVLLGGGYATIPPRYCPVAKRNKVQEYSPVDLYFACLNDPYDWDKNKNTIHGEAIDSISMAPSFAVTRVPVDDLESANNYVTKLIEYEHFPIWEGNMLLAGAEMDSVPCTNPLAFNLASTRETDVTKQHFLFDTKNSFHFKRDSLNKTIFNVNNLNAVLQKGYNIVEVVTHGVQYGWVMESDNSNETNDDSHYYDYNDAKTQRNSAHSIITSLNACHTSAFDSQISRNNKSLCEGFISGADNRVVGYLGTSTYGYYAPNSSMIGPSFAYEYDFYNYWLNADYNIEKKFGPIIANVKYERSGEQNNWDEYRWTQYGFNPMGDPEMPLYTQEPFTFNNVTFEVDSSQITITANEPGSNICITGVGSNNSYIRRKGKDNLTANSLPDKFSVCITKQDFKPWHYVFQRYADGTISYLEVESLDQYFSDNMGLLQDSYGHIDLAYASPLGFKITTSTNAKNSAQFIIAKITGEVSKTLSAPNGINVCTSIPYFTTYPSGIYTISLVVDGQLVDSWKVFVQ